MILIPSSTPSFLGVGAKITLKDTNQGTAAGYPTNYGSLVQFNTSTYNPSFWFGYKDNITLGVWYKDTNHDWAAII